MKLIHKKNMAIPKEDLSATQTRHQDNTANSRMSAPRKLSLLVTVVERNKSEFYADLIQSFEVNMQLITAA